MFNNKPFKNVLYDSDDNGLDLPDVYNISPVEIQKTSKIKLPSKLKWPSKITNYTILTKTQIQKLESEFILRKLKFNKSNIRKLSADLDLPYKRCLNYFMGIIRFSDTELNKNATRMISEINIIQEQIKKSWDLFLGGCEKYGK
ncbi:hypothetical protein P3W45_000853 [Vairimorpha bombi]|jgi:hypothetical protein